MFNTLRYAKMLEDVGFSRDQSETSVKILVEIMEEKLASKQDLQELKLTSKQDLHEMKTEMNHRFSELEYKLTIKLGTMMTIAIGVTATLVISSNF